MKSNYPKLEKLQIHYGMKLKTIRNGVELGAFIVMPNHIHGVLKLTKYVETNDKYLDNSSETIRQKRFQNIGKNSLSSIILGYKSAVTKYANRMNLEFGWQPRFYDHIIFDEFALKEISIYILQNPKNWEYDDLFEE